MNPGRRPRSPLRILFGNTVKYQTLGWIHDVFLSGLSVQLVRVDASTRVRSCWIPVQSYQAALSHAGFADHRWAIKELWGPKCTTALYFLLIWPSPSHFPGRKFKWSTPMYSWSTEGNFPSVKWLKPSSAEQLPAFSKHSHWHPFSIIPAPPSSDLASVTTSQHVSAPLEKVARGATTTALFRDISWN